MTAALDDVARFLFALEYAAGKHRDQRREDAHASPFINHLIETVNLLRRAGVTHTETLVAAALHDVVEHTATTAKEIEREFGKEVRRLVDELTDDVSLPLEARRGQQIARAAGLSRQAKLIKLADKTANLRALPVDWSPAERHAYIDCAEQVGVALKGAHPRLEAWFREAAQSARSRADMPAPKIPAPPPPTPTHVSGPVAADGRMAALVQTILAETSQIRETAKRIAETVELGTAPPAGDPSGGAKRRHGRRRWTDPKWRALAEDGVAQVTIQDIDTPKPTVRIDDGSPFVVSRHDAHLLVILTSQKPQAPDLFAAFVSLREIAARLGKKINRPCSPHAITVAISRLRERLEKEKACGNPLLVETGRHGARFRVRATASAVTTAAGLRDKPVDTRLARTTGRMLQRHGHM